MNRFACEAVLFDLDGVLVDSSRSIERVWREWASHHRLDADRVLETAHGRRVAEIVRSAAPHLDPEAEAEEMKRLEIGDVENVRKVPGASSLLPALPAGSWAIVTSGPRDLATARLAQTGLPVPRALVCAEDVEGGKPAPEAYLAGAGLLGVEPERCVVVEDAPSGVEAALSAGMEVIAVTTTNPSSALANASATTRSLGDIQFRQMDSARDGKPRLELLVYP